MAKAHQEGSLLPAYLAICRAEKAAGAFDISLLLAVARILVNFAQGEDKSKAREQQDSTYIFSTFESA
jgi:hypothetical protein